MPSLIHLPSVIQPLVPLAPIDSLEPLRLEPVPAIDAVPAIPRLDPVPIRRRSALVQRSPRLHFFGVPPTTFVPLISIHKLRHRIVPSLLGFHLAIHLDIVPAPR